MQNTHLKAIYFALYFLSFTLNSPTVFAQNYASLAWKDVEDGSVGGRCLQILDLDNDGKKEILASGGLSGSDHFFVYDFKNNDYQRRWDSKLYLGGINAMATYKNDNESHHRICVLSKFNKVEIYDGRTMAVVDSFNVDYGEVVEIAIGNVDATPDKELVLIGRYGFKVYSLTTRQLKWTSTDIKGMNVKIADLDKDGKNEIITSTRSWELTSNLSVIDGYTKTVKWSSDAKQFNNFYLFDVNSDGFLDIVGATTGEIFYFNSQTRRPITLVSGPAYDFSGLYYVGDIDNNGSAEVLVGSFRGTILGYSFNGVQMWESPSRDYALVRFDVGDVDGDGKPEVVRSTSGTSNGDAHLYIHDYATKQFRFGNTVNFGYSTFGIMDFDGDGALDLTMSNTGYLGIPTSSYANDTKPFFRNYNLSNRQKTRTTELSFNGIEQMPILAYGQSRSPSQREIATEIGIYDANTHRLIFDFFARGLAGVFVPIKFADLDNDGTDEVLSSVYGKFQVYKSLEGTYKRDWSITTLGGVKFTSVVVKNIDADTAMEVITIHNYQKITIYDGVTHEIEWQSEDIKAFCLDVADVDLDGQLDIIIGDDRGGITILDGRTKAVKKRIYAFDFTVRQVKAVNLDTTPQLEIIAVESDEVKIFDYKTGTALWKMPEEYANVFPSIFSIDAKDVNKDGFMELYFCNKNGLFIFGINQRVINGRTALQEPTTMPMTCSPNPTTGVLDVVFDPKMSGNMVLEVVNTEGVVVFQKNLQMVQTGRQQQQIDLNTLSNGLYILKIKAQNEVAYRKLVISK